MRKYAILSNMAVISIVELSDDQVLQAMQDNEMVIDVQDLVTTPQVGWVLNGNNLVPGPGQQFDMHQYVSNRIKHYQSVAPKILVDMYAQNTLLGITNAQSHEMFNEYLDVLMAIREGAFPTAIYALQQKQPGGFVTQEMLDSYINILQGHML